MHDHALYTPETLSSPAHLAPEADAERVHLGGQHDLVHDHAAGGHRHWGPVLGCRRHVVLRRVRQRALSQSHRCSSIWRPCEAVTDQTRTLNHSSGLQQRCRHHVPGMSLAGTYSSRSLPC